MATERGRVHAAWAVLHVDAFSAEPSDTKAKSHCHLHPCLSQTHNHETHPQICAFLLKYTRLKLKAIPGYDWKTLSTASLSSSGLAAAVCSPFVSSSYAYVPTIPFT